MMSKPITLFMMRFSPEMHEDLKAAAEREHRSLHGQIVYILHQWLKDNAR